jgi:hypothetical protein
MGKANPLLIGSIYDQMGAYQRVRPGRWRDVGV